MCTEQPELANKELYANLAGLGLTELLGGLYFHAPR